MTDKKRVIIRIPPRPDQAQTEVKVEGVCGSGCQDLTRRVEEALGKKVSDTPTDEMYLEATEEQTHTQDY